MKTIGQLIQEGVIAMESEISDLGTETPSTGPLVVICVKSTAAQQASALAARGGTWTGTGILSRTAENPTPGTTSKS